MEGKQKIHCTVETCKYNDEGNNICKLQAINVEPIENCNTKKPDESMCASYEKEEN